MVQLVGSWACMRFTLGSNLVLTSAQYLFPVVVDSTLPCFVNSQLVASCQLEFLIMFC